MTDKRRQGAVYRRLAKAARESGDCWLCHRPINLALRFPDPWSASADHADPLKTGGLAHGPMLPAHLVCNERRSAGKTGVDYLAPIPDRKPRRPGTLRPIHSQDW